MENGVWCEGLPQWFSTCDPDPFGKLFSKTIYTAILHNKSSSKNDFMVGVTAA